VSPAEVIGRGWTTRELARMLRVSPDRIREWIHSGQLRAINTAGSRCGKPRFVVLPHHLADFERARQVATPPPKPIRRQKRKELTDYYPGD
jgi:excisionase family DNA binding protein